MSSFIGTPSGVGFGQWLTRADNRLLSAVYQPDGTKEWITAPGVWEPVTGGYANEFWPGGVGLDASGAEWLEAGWYARPEFSSGAVSRWAFTGVSRDQYGSALGAMTVKLFKTVGGGNPDLKDAKIDEIVSDQSGNFTVYSQHYPDTHYIVTFKSGAPDVQGVTVNTLTGA